MVHESLLLSDVDRVHLHVRIVVHPQVLQVHVVRRPNEELFLLLSTTHVTMACSNPVVLLLLGVLLLLLLL